MIKPEQVPDEVIKKFATWQFPNCSENLMRRMLADAINTWPGALHRIGIKRHKNGEWRQPYPMICLPLPQEGGDD